MNTQANINRYLKIMKWVRERCAVEGWIPLTIGGKDCRYKQIEKAAFKKYLGGK